MLYILNLYSAMCQLNFNKRRRKSSLMPDFKNLITNESKQAEDSGKRLRKKGRKHLRKNNGE